MYGRSGSYQRENVADCYITVLIIIIIIIIIPISVLQMLYVASRLPLYLAPSFLVIEVVLD